MAESKRLPPIELVAVERGFVNGRLVHPGSTFLFDPNPTDAGGAKRKVGPDGQRRIPKWAALPAEAAERMKPKRNAGDLKPKEAQEAVKSKAGALSGDALA